MVVESHFSTSFSTSFHQKYLKNTYSSLTPKTTKKSPQTAGNPWFSLLFREIFLSDLKPLAGLEPATHALRMRCATNCATMAHLFKKIRPLQMQQPHQDDLTGNRTRVYAVRGRRLDRLTNRPYLILFNRGDVIRTRDLCVPNAALYQTEPRLDTFCIIMGIEGNVNYILKKVFSFVVLIYII